MKISPTMQVLMKRVDLTLLYPVFVEKWATAIARVHDKGHDFFAIDGFRDPARQAKLFAQGRELRNGVWVVVDEDKVVTRAEPWKSTHNYGIAGDACRDADATREGLQPGWKIEDYEVYALECHAVGLDAAFYWTSFKEGPHAQLPLKKFGITTSQLRKQFERGGLPEVWKFLDSYNWRT